MDYRSTIRDVRRIDKRPTQSTNVPGSVRVSMGGEATLPTLEGRLIRAIRLLRMAALRTATAGVAGINGHNGNSSLLCLIDDKGPELSEGPGMENAAHLPPSRNPRTNMRQFFQRNRTLRVFSGRDDLLTNSMVHIFGKAKLFAGEILQSALGRLRPFLLQPGPKALVPMADAFHGRATVPLAVGVGKNVGHAKIAAQNILDGTRLRIIDVTGGRKVEGSAKENQIRFALLCLQHRLLALAGLVWNLQPPTSGPDGNGLLLDVPAQNPQIVCNGAIQPIRALAALVELVGIGNLGDGSNDRLRRESGELRSGRGIAEFMDSKLGKLLRFPCLFRDPITAAIRLVQSVQQCRERALVCLQFDRGRKLQRTIVSRMETDGIPPTAKAVGFLPGEL